jgi:hypothetical protein
MSFAKVNWLDGVTSAETTDPVQVLGSTRYALQVAYTGSPSSGQVLLQGSLDGVNWVGDVDVNPGGTTTARSDKPWNFIRLAFAGFSGGSSPTVSASVIAV